MSHNKERRSKRDEKLDKKSQAMEELKAEREKRKNRTGMKGCCYCYSFWGIIAAVWKCYILFQINATILHLGVNEFQVCVFLGLCVTWPLRVVFDSTDAVVLTPTPPWNGLKTELSSQSTEWLLVMFSYCVWIGHLDCYLISESFKLLLIGLVISCLHLLVSSLAHHPVHLATDFWCSHFCYSTGFYCDPLQTWGFFLFPCKVTMIIVVFSCISSCYTHLELLCAVKWGDWK